MAPSFIFHKSPLFTLDKLPRDRVDSSERERERRFLKRSFISLSNELSNDIIAKPRQNTLCFNVSFCYSFLQKTKKKNFIPLVNLYSNFYIVPAHYFYPGSKFKLRAPRISRICMLKRIYAQSRHETYTRIIQYIYRSKYFFAKKSIEYNGEYITRSATTRSTAYYIIYDTHVYLTRARTRVYTFNQFCKKSLMTGRDEGEF